MLNTGQFISFWTLDANDTEHNKNGQNVHSDGDNAARLCLAVREGEV
jgi:hypothetical protein